MNMVEKVARAISWIDLPTETKIAVPTLTIENHWVDDKYIVLARAAIEAMREPSEEMLAEAEEKLHISGRKGFTPKEWYLSMIDAALKE